MLPTTQRRGFVTGLPSYHHLVTLEQIVPKFALNIIFIVPSESDVQVLLPVTSATRESKAPPQLQFDPTAGIRTAKNIDCYHHHRDRTTEAIISTARHQPRAHSHEGLYLSSP